MARRMEAEHRSIDLDPATRAATLYSSSAFQSMYFSTSGWSALRVTIFAARRVVPPLLMLDAERSATFRKERRPEDTPPPESGSFEPRILEKFEPVPEPYLNSLASRVIRSMIPPSFTRSSSTFRMKQAWG